MPDATGAPWLPACVRPIAIGSFAEPPVAANPARLDTPEADDPALVIYTSGSTGQPKGIVRSHRQVAYLGWKKLHRFHLNPVDKVLAPYTLTTGGGVVGCMMTLMSGAAFYPINLPTTGARAMLDLARQERITLLTGTPSLLRVLFALSGAREALASLRALYTTGETLARADVVAWRTVLPADCRIAYVYGMSEAAPLAEWFLPRRLPQQARLPIGFLNADHEYAIAAAASEPPVTAEGDLWVRSRLLSLGEWRGGRLVPGRLLADPDDPSSAVLRTGDVVRLRPDGLIEFIGRSDSQVKIRGNRVEPAETEEVLRRSPGVADVAVLARRSGEETVLVAFIVPVACHGGPALSDALTRALRAALPAFMHPAHMVFIDRMPRTPTGKPDVHALLKRAGAPAPANGMIGRLRGLFRDRGR